MANSLKGWQTRRKRYTAEQISEMAQPAVARRVALRMRQLRCSNGHRYDARTRRQRLCRKCAASKSKRYRASNCRRLTLLPKFRREALAEARETRDTLRARMLKAHPDRPTGSHEKFIKARAAYEKAA